MTRLEFVKNTINPNNVIANPRCFYDEHEALLVANEVYSDSQNGWSNVAIRYDMGYVPCCQMINNGIEHRILQITPGKYCGSIYVEIENDMYHLVSTDECDSELHVLHKLALFTKPLIDLIQLVVADE